MATFAIHPKQSMQKIILIMAFSLNVTFVIAQTGVIQFNDNTSLVIDNTIKAITVLKPTVLLYPNPSKNKVIIQMKGFETGMTKLQIISDKGTVVRKEDRLLINGNEEVVMFFSLPPAIYFIKITQGKKEVKKRLVVLH